MSTTTDLTTLKINYLTQAQYDAALQNDEINADEIYMTPVGTVGTVTSVGVNNATNGGLSVSGSPITSSGSISIGHTNVLGSAQTTQAIYPIKIDKNGHVSQYGSAFNLKSEVLNMFYPVGSYYETSDTTFNPNTVWGGTWVLEAEGQVHVSAGTNYSVSGANTGTYSTSDGGTDQIVYTPSGSNAAVTLTAAQSGTQSQSITSGSGTSHSHGAGTDYRFMRTKGALGRDNVAKGSTTTQTYVYSTGDVSYTSSTQSESSHTHTVTVAAKNATASHNHTFTGTQVQLDNMQPYIIVNRWHRTA